MGKVKTFIAIIGVSTFLFSANMSGYPGGSGSGQASSTSTQTTSKSTSTKSNTTPVVSKTTQASSKSKPAVSKTTSTGTKSKTVVSKTPQTTSKSKTTVSKTTQSGSKSKPTVSKSTQTGSKTKSTVSKSTGSESKPAGSVAETTKIKDSGVIGIGTQTWSVLNLNVSTFRNGDTIPEAKTNQEWVAAGEAKKPAWCYYNNDPANGPKFGKLYNWYAVNDPRGLAPEGWTLTTDENWSQIAYYLGGPDVAGAKMKSAGGWKDGYNGNNTSGFTGLPGGYRIENGIFQNLGSVGTWWSATESKSLSALDHYLSQTGSLGRSSNPKQRGESVRCIKK